MQKHVAVVLWLVVLNACAAASLDAYKPAGPLVSRPSIDSLVIRSGKDERPPGRIGTGFYAWIPLVPYGHQTFLLGESVDSTRPGTFMDDLTATVAKDLQVAGFASSVASLGRVAPFETSRPGYSMQLTIKDGVCHRYFTLYGISLAGFFPWVVGAPISYGSVDVGFEAELKDPSGTSLGRQTFAGKADVTEWLYTGLPPGACLRKLPNVYAQISPQLRAFVSRTLRIQPQ